MLFPLWWSVSKLSACQCRSSRFNAWLGKIPEESVLTPVLLPLGQRNPASWSMGVTVSHKLATEHIPITSAPYLCFPASYTHQRGTSYDSVKTGLGSSRFRGPLDNWRSAPAWCLCRLPHLLTPRGGHLWSPCGPSSSTGLAGGSSNYTPAINTPFHNSGEMLCGHFFPLETLYRGLILLIWMEFLVSLLELK